MDQEFYLSFDQTYPLSANGQLVRSNNGLDYVYATGIRRYYYGNDVDTYRQYSQILYFYGVYSVTLSAQTISSTYRTYNVTISDDPTLTFTHKGTALLYTATEGDDRLQWCAIWLGSDNLYYMQRLSVKTDELIGSVISGESMGKMLGDICIAYLLWNPSSTTSLNSTSVTTRINNTSKTIIFGCSEISGQTCTIGFMRGTTDQETKFCGVVYATAIPVVAEIRSELNQGLSDIEDLKQEAEDSFNNLSNRIDLVTSNLSSDFVAR